MTAAVIGLLLASMGAQVAAVSLIPRTAGFTRPAPTMLCCLLLILSATGIARLSRRGINLGILFPVMSATVQLSIVLLGILVFGENASPLRVFLLVSACVMIGAASAL